MKGIWRSPKKVTINPDVLTKENIDSVCLTQVLDKILCARKGLIWNQELADKIEEENRFYFVVRTSKEYGVISGEILEPVLSKLNIIPGELSDSGKKCMYHYLKSLA
jgi:hypothetical protein